MHYTGKYIIYACPYIPIHSILYILFPPITISCRSLRIKIYYFMAA